MDVGRVVKNERTYPVQRVPDGQVFKQRSEIVRHIYDLGRVVKLILKNVGSLTYVCVNDLTRICIVPTTRKYCSDVLIVVPINNHMPKLPMVVNQIM